jgi:hypothetical protein
MTAPASDTPPEKDSEGRRGRAGDGEPAGGFPEPPGDDPGDRSEDPSPHHALNHPVTEPDPTEWPDPYDEREDPRDPPDPDERPFGDDPHPSAGITSTSQPHPSEDPEAEDWEAPERDRLDE